MSIFHNQQDNQQTIHSSFKYCIKGEYPKILKSLACCGIPYRLQASTIGTHQMDHVRKRNKYLVIGLSELF